MDALPEEARLAGHVWLDLVSVADGTNDDTMKSLHEAFAERFNETGAIQVRTEIDDDGNAHVDPDPSHLVGAAVHIMTNLVTELADKYEVSRDGIIQVTRSTLFRGQIRL